MDFDSSSQFQVLRLIFRVVDCLVISCREEKSARGARAADVADRAPSRLGGPVQLTSKPWPLPSHVSDWGRGSDKSNILSCS